MSKWFGTLAGLLNVVLESRCPLCHRSTSQVLCQTCEQQIGRCRLTTPEQTWQPPLPLFAWGVYGGALKRTIATLKYDNHPQLAQPLGYWLAQAWLHSSLATTRNVIVVPIPMHESKRQQRGFNQAELLADAFCRQAGLPLQRQGLIRQRETEAQFGLNSTIREQNLAGAFQLGDAFLHRRPIQSILILDDIFTTGATTRSAIQTFQQHHISVFGVVAIARTAMGSRRPPG